MTKAFKTPLHKYLIKLPEATLEYPFGPEAAVYKVDGKIFAIAVKTSINLKCDPDHAQELRSVFTEVTPGYHMNKKHWNTVQLTGDLPKSEIHRQIDHSYDLIVKKLPRATKQRLRILYERLAWLK
ncbi:MAG: MmcQ/YjbR family DNA-binding protein [Moraxellaceae bacterium]|nr:MAG: MmcQ/YjbR family DNA-binding protein [Moraxellaceae bacterium]